MSSLIANYQPIRPACTIGCVFGRCGFGVVFGVIFGVIFSHFFHNFLGGVPSLKREGVVFGVIFHNFFTPFST